jgi:hypothetical protein
MHPDTTSQLAKLRGELLRTTEADLARRSRSRTHRLALVSALLLAGLSVTAWAETRPSASDVAPVLTHKETTGDKIPKLHQPAGAPSFIPSSARLITHTAGSSSWVVVNASGDLCVVTKLAAHPTQTNWGCSPPVAVAGSAFRDLGISMTSTSPSARPWLGIIDGLVRPDIASVRVTFDDGQTEQATPNSDGGFAIDETQRASGGAPMIVEALTADGTVTDSTKVG